MIFHINNNVYPIAFKGYQEDIRTGEALIKEINKMGSHSTTHDYRRLHDVKMAYEDAADKLDITTPPDELVKAAFKADKLLSIKTSFYRVFHRLEGRFMSARSHLITILDKNGTKEEYVNRILETIKTEKLANCGELAEVGQHLLAKKGIKVDQVGFVVNTKGTLERRKGKALSDHAFLLKDAGKDADFSDPKTWSNEAIIIDPWLGIVKRAHIALKEIKEWMDFDPQKETLLFMRTNFEDKLMRYQERKKEMQKTNKK